MNLVQVKAQRRVRTSFTKGRRHGVSSCPVLPNSSVFQPSSRRWWRRAAGQPGGLLAESAGCRLAIRCLHAWLPGAACWVLSVTAHAGVHWRHSALQPPPWIQRPGPGSEAHESWRKGTCASWRSPGQQPPTPLLHLRGLFGLPDLASGCTRSLNPRSGRWERP